LALTASLVGQSREVILATTTSVRDAGLLDALLPPFERATGLTVRVIAVGSGQAMELARRGEVDIAILHEPAGETRLIEEGFGIDRRPLWVNEFILVGPEDDPAGVRGRDIARAFRLIEGRQRTFVSRGDRSGTHARERRIWAGLNIEPAGEWYRETGQGMGATLVIADQLDAYTLTDDATWLALRAPRQLVVLVEGDSVLANPYHMVRVNPARFPRLNAEGARRLADYLLSDETRALVASYGVERFGRPLFRLMPPTSAPASLPPPD